MDSSHHSGSAQRPPFVPYPHPPHTQGELSSPLTMQIPHLPQHRLWSPQALPPHPAVSQPTISSQPGNNYRPSNGSSSGMIGGHPSPDSSTSSPEKGAGSISPVSNGSSSSSRDRKNAPYIPSYMDLSNGPEPCVVCGDAATGYHYRCMTCEGCKGFFRRTIQKSLQYHCKWNNNCAIDKTTRNQCQACRMQKCIAVGMATDLVLNEKQRVAKRRLIEDNRERRRQEQVKVKVKPEPCQHHDDYLTEDDQTLIDDIILAYEHTALNCLPPKKPTGSRTSTGDMVGPINGDVWQQLAEVMTPSIVKVVEFAKRVPGFLQLNADDQILLLKSCCMEIMCLRAACRYDPDDGTLCLQNGLVLTRSELGKGGLGLLVEPIFEFAVGLSKLNLDETEIALLAAVLLMQSDRTGLKEPEGVEKLQDAVLGAYKRYIAHQRPSQPVHWAKILMKVTDLRTISTRHAERVLCIKLDSPEALPPLFLEMFDEAPPVLILQLLTGTAPPELDMG